LIPVDPGLLRTGDSDDVIGHGVIFGGVRAVAPDATIIDPPA
jgi:hypothetical protein